MGRAKKSEWVFGVCGLGYLKIIANANNFALAKILFFCIYEIAVILGFAR